MIFLFKNIWQQLPPELSHKIAISALSTFYLSSFLPKTKPVQNLACNLAGIKLSHPIGLAAGFNKNGKNLKSISKLGFSFIEIGTVTRFPQEGNPKPRIFKDIKNKAIINRMGFNSDGYEAVAKNILKQLPLPVPIGVNIGPNKNSSDIINDFCLGWKCFNNIADYITINISSPNTPGLRSWHSPNMLKKILQAINRTKDNIKLFVKLSPDRDKTLDKTLFNICLDNKVSGVILSNSTVKRPSYLSKKIICEAGGLSGSPLIENTLHEIELFNNNSPKGLALIAVGGFDHATDIDKALSNGANAVQLFSSLVFSGPTLVSKIINKLNLKYLNAMDSSIYGSNTYKTNLKKKTHFSQAQ